MKIATWNVNSIKARIDVVLAWFREASPDVACLQELKCVDEAFPRAAFEDLGYHVETHGQKTYNGVALISRKSPEEVVRGLDGDDDDDHARYMEAVYPSDSGPVRVASIYLPNGNPAPGPKYDYKLAWMARLKARVSEVLTTEEAAVFAGDYNVIPGEADVHDPAAWRRDALFLPDSRAALHTITTLGLTDAVRATTSAPELYTFWDYQAGAWQKNNGIRIDHLLLTPQAADRLQGTRIDRHVRAWEKPSDHVPVVADLAD